MTQKTSEAKKPDQAAQAKMAQEFQNKINNKLEELAKVSDFKEYFKIAREIFTEFIGTWKYVEVNLERDALKDYEMFLKSFGDMAKLDKEKNKIDKEKFATIEKFNAQILKSFEAKEYDKTSQQLFYVLLGNVMEHIGQSQADMQKFDLQKDLYPKLKYPLGLTFFLFQNLTFGPISQKINSLSKEYLQKYCALLLGTWRTVFDLMRYEKQMASMQAGQQANAGQNKDKKAEPKSDQTDKK